MQHSATFKNQNPSKCASAKSLSVLPATWKINRRCAISIARARWRWALRRAFCSQRFEWRFLASPKALIPRWLNLTVGKDVSHARFLEEEPVCRSMRVGDPQGSWEGSNLWSFPPISPLRCNERRGPLNSWNFASGCGSSIISNGLSRPPRGCTVPLPANRRGCYYFSFTTAMTRYVDVRMEKCDKNRHLGEGTYLDRICPLYSKKRGFFCAPASFLSRFFLRRSWKEEANSRGVCVVHEGGSWEPQRLRAPWESGPGERSLLLRVTRESVDARKFLHGGGEEGKGDGAKVGRWEGPRQTRYRKKSGEMCRVQSRSYLGNGAYAGKYGKNEKDGRVLLKRSLEVNKQIAGT